jgi:hypothetical protein
LDTYVHYWNGWWVRQALREGQSPFHTDYLFYPQGLSLVYHNFAWLSILGWLVLQPIVGGFAAYNLTFLLSLALCGWAAFLLASELIGDRRVAILCGLIYQCWPLRLAQLDHPNLVSTYCIPLFLLFLARAVRCPRRRSGVLAGVFFALVGYTRWQLLIPASIVGAVYLAFTLPRVWNASFQWLAPLVLAGVVATIALTPPALLLLREQQANPANLLKESDEVAMQTDLLAYLTPSASHPVFGVYTSTAYDRYYSDRSSGRRFPAYVGVTTLVLGVLGIWRAPRRGLPWLAAASVFVSLALGFVLRVNGRLYPAVPMPYRLARMSFVVRLLRLPDRFSLFVALPMSILAAQGAYQLVSTPRTEAMKVGNAATWILCGLVMFEYLAVPVPLRHLQAPSFHKKISEETEKYAVLNLPVNSQESKRYMFEQVTHQHPILQGKTARLPEDAYAYLESHPLLRSVRRSGEVDPALTDVGRQLGALADDNVAYILVQKRIADPDHVAHWRRYLLTSPRFEDDSVAVFSTSPTAGRDFALERELSPGIGPIEVVGPADCLDRGGVLEVDVGWGTTKSLGEDFILEMSLRPREGTNAVSQVYAVTPDWATSSWPANSIAWGYYPLHVSESTASGTYDVELSLVEQETGGRQGEAMVAGTVKVPDSRCTLPVPSGAAGANAVFGDSLRLLGYRILRDARELTITLHWRCEQRMEVNYKIFVHVFDPATDIPVAQDDAMPKQWEYPTTFWMPGEMVKDAIPISLAGVPAGDYGLAVGAYNPQTMERLAVMDATGHLHADGRLVLPGEIIHVGESDS